MKKILSILCVLFFATTVSADTVKLVVPFAAGGPADRVARNLQLLLTKHTNHNYIVEYQLGAGGQIAAMSVAKNHNTETVLLVHSAAVVINSLHPDAQYSMKDFQPVAYLGEIQWALITNQHSHVNTVDKFKSERGPIFFGTGGVNTAGHLSGELLKNTTGKNIIHVPFKGESAALVELHGNRISLVFASTQTAGPDLKFLAVTGSSRNANLPAVPTLNELGVKGFEDNPNWYILLASPGSDTSVIKQIQTAVRTALEDPAESILFAQSELVIDRKKILNVQQFIIAQEKKLKPLVQQTLSK